MSLTEVPGGGIAVSTFHEYLTKHGWTSGPRREKRTEITFPYTLSYGFLGLRHYQVDLTELLHS